MSDRSPYEQLGVTEDASFDEIQTAKQRLVEQSSGDAKLIQQIEVAYDAVLMDRLRLRQQGKIKVPEGIRFPERSVAPIATATATAEKRAPEWLRDAIDTPERNDVLIPAGAFTALGLLAAMGAQYAPLTLAFGAGAHLYFLNRKAQKFGRAVLLTLIVMIVGIAIGSQVAPALASQLATETLAAWFTFILLWLSSSFLR